MENDGLKNTIMNNLKLTRIKMVDNGLSDGPCPERDVIWEDCLFTHDATCEDYDWIVVYDDFPRRNIGTVIREVEPLRCPPNQTILLTMEPPSIKIYGSPYTSQFGAVLTTHPQELMPRTNYHLGKGCVEWHYGKALNEVLTQQEFQKTKIISTICSAKQQTHTLHKKRYVLTKYLSEKLPELEWYGHGVRELGKKMDAMDDYKYHLAVENHCESHHWTEKLADSFLAMTLPFYSGDPCAAECFPPESFIPIPIDQPEEAYRIIRNAIDKGEYEKRLPFIREARQRVIKQYNLYAQVVAIIHQHRDSGVKQSVIPKAVLKGRHALRRNPINMLLCVWERLKYQLFLKHRLK